MPSRDAWLAIVNPASGRSRARALWPAVEASLRREGVALDVAHTTRPHEGESIARRAVLDGRRRILVAGGDGSVHDVVNGIMSAGLADDGCVTLAIAPDGTGNDWARSLGVRRDPAGIAAMIVAGRTMLHDVGVIDFPGSAGERRWFINVAGAGYDAYVLSQLPRRVPSTLAYLKGAITGLAGYRSPIFGVTVGGERIDQRLLLALVANGRYCGNRMHVAPGARMDDGLLDVVLVEDVNLAKVLLKIPKLYLGTILRDPVVRHRQTASLRIEASPRVAVEADGQVVGETPAEFSIRTRAIRVVIANSGPAPAGA